MSAAVREQHGSYFFLFLLPHPYSMEKQNLKERYKQKGIPHLGCFHSKSVKYYGMLLIIEKASLLIMRLHAHLFYTLLSSHCRLQVIDGVLESK